MGNVCSMKKKNKSSNQQYQQAQLQKNNKNQIKNDKDKQEAIFCEDCNVYCHQSDPELALETMCYFCTEYHLKAKNFDKYKSNIFFMILSNMQKKLSEVRFENNLKERYQFTEETILSYKHFIYYLMYNLKFDNEVNMKNQNSPFVFKSYCFLFKASEHRSEILYLVAYIFRQVAAFKVKNDTSIKDIFDFLVNINEYKKNCPEVQQVITALVETLDEDALKNLLAYKPKKGTGWCGYKTYYKPSLKELGIL